MKLKRRLKEFLGDIREDFNCGLHAVCGKPSPMKRLVIVLIIGVALSVVSVCTLVRSIYNIGKRDAEVIHIEHIKQLELKYSGDSINSIKSYGNEYE
ncbi:MAG: TraL conjugative transposon family protein [Dysgonamonadaceae bacterium]|jgi:hypothetical protein|nr:TraL conjugative transposon family protein [Dysgonamonadaceae bacterium]